MHLLLSFLLLFSLSYTVLSIPTISRPRREGRSFRVEQVKRSDYVAHGPAALRNAYRKYGIALTDFNGVDLEDFEPLEVKHSSAVAGDQDTAPGSDQTGAVSATSVQSDVEFVSPVVVGGQNVSLIFDTGSADMWVMNTKLPESLLHGHTAFDPKKSRTFHDVEGGEFNISYGDSSYAYGGVGKDTVSIGGATVAEQTFGLPTSVSESFTEDTASNGLVGLGFSSINTMQPGPQKTFFDNVAASLDEPVLTARLRSDGVGEYEFGRVDQRKYSGSLVNISVDASNGFWQFDAGQFAVGDGPLRKVTGRSIAIADTGTSLMLASSDLVQAYYREVGGALYAGSVGGYIYPCKTDLPNLSVALGNKFKATIPGSFIHFAEVGKNKTTGEQLCFGGVQSNEGSDMQIFGDVFLKSLFVVFDQRGPSLGFASPT